MDWMEEISYQYRKTEYFFIDVPAIFQFCLPALVIQFIRLSLLQIATNVGYQLVSADSLFSGRKPIKHAASVLLGFLMMTYFYAIATIAVFCTLVILAYLWLSNRHVLFVGSCLLFITGWWADLYTVDLRTIQGPLMILAMKCISILDTRKSRPEFLLFLHYSFSPSSVIFGPIIPFDDFQREILRRRVFSLRVRSALGTITGAFLTFITANCICQSVEWVSTEDIPPFHIRFLRAYKNALEFRMSHYFISFLSAFQMHLGIPTLASSVVDFWAIEAPTSMRKIVRSWNLPMHDFLKKCVYKKILHILDGNTAVVATFLVSAALHLFEIRVTIVLFALSLISVIESRLQCHLPRALAEPWMRVTTFIHLVFFGSIMMGHDADEESLWHFIMERWLELSFISLKIIIVECVLCVILELRRFMKQRK